MVDEKNWDKEAIEKDKMKQRQEPTKFRTKIQVTQYDSVAITQYIPVAYLRKVIQTADENKMLPKREGDAKAFIE